MVITTSGGLYRYQTFDRVVCDGYSSGMPILRFVGRGNLSADMVGEKLTDEFVATCLEGIPGFRMLLPVRADQPAYLLVLDESGHPDAESVRNIVENRLYNNPHYAYARNVGQLKQLMVVKLKNPLDTYLQSAVHAGVRLGDIKVPSLCIKSGIFDAHIGVAAWK